MTKGGITEPTPLDGFLFTRIGRVAAQSVNHGGPPMQDVEVLYPVAPRIWVKVYRALRRLQGKGLIKMDPYAYRAQSEFLVRLTDLGVTKYREDAS